MYMIFLLNPLLIDQRSHALKSVITYKYLQGSAF